MPRLEVQLLGDFRLVYNSRPLTTIRTHRQQSLLVYLLLHHNAPQPRQHIAFRLWPDSTEKQAQGNLRTLLSRLHKSLPEAALFIQSDTHSLQWRPDGPFTLDVAAFVTAVTTAQTAADWRAAVDLYHGPLLPHWYDEWLGPERDHLQQLFFHAGDRLLQLLESQRDYQAAAQTAQRLLRQDPLHEATYRRLMHIQALNGEKVAALRTYHTCANILEKELGVAPDDATRELYERLLHAGLGGDVAAVTKPETAVTALVGRKNEMNQLKTAWQTTINGRASMVLISGEAGIGKTRLAAELLEWAKRQGIATAATRSYEAEGELAYAPVVSWLRAPLLQAAWAKLPDLQLVELARLLPEILVERLDLPAPEPFAQSWQRQRLFEALAQAVLAYNRPLLLHIDDLQWCDQETLQWLHFLLRFDIRAPLLVVGTFRPEEIMANHPLTSLQLALRHSRQLTELALEPLPEAETAMLAAQIAGQSWDAAEVARLCRETEGIPLFIIEMMRSGPPMQQTLPPTVQAVIKARFAQLTPQAQALLEQAAVIGRAFQADILAQASGMAEDTLVVGLDELWRRRIIREHGGMEYDFSHDKIREVVYSELSEARRRLLHRRVAQTLEAYHASNVAAFSGQIAAHYELAELAAQAIPHHHRAANVAWQLYANEEAIAIIRRALRLLSELSPTTPAEWRLGMTGELQESLGDVLHFTAHYDEARAAYTDALTAVQGMVVSGHHRIWQCRLYRKTGSSYLPQHWYEEALQQYDRAKTSLGVEPTEPVYSWWREWIELQQERKYVFYWLNRRSEIVEILEESRPILAQYGTPVQRASFFDPNLLLRQDRFAVSEETVEFTREWMAAHLELGDLGDVAAAHFRMGFVLLWHDDLAEAEAEMLTALEMSTRTGDVNLRARCLTYLTILYRKQARLNTVQEYCDRSLAAAEEAAMPEYVATAQANKAWVAWRDGDWRRTQRYGRAALALWRQLPAGHASAAFQWTALFPLMAVALADENISEAVVHAQATVDQSQQKLPDGLAAVLENAITAWQQDRSTHTSRWLMEAITLARQMNFL